jgi:O-antigen ligase
MSPLIASFVFASAVFVLFVLDRDRQVRTSKALWLPVVWIWIVGSRPVSDWLGINSELDTAVQLAEGSPVDAAVFAVLLAAGMIVLIGRRRRATVCLKSSWPIVIYFAFCLLSLLWSDYPDVAFKRWTKALGDLVMVLIVVTDPEQDMALRRFLSRTGFVLLPASLLLIKYFGNLGRAFDAYGELSITGVTTNKNLLGVINLVLSMGAAWRVIALLRNKTQANRNRHLVAQGSLLAIGVTLFVMAHSATSAACFGIGVGLMLATGLPVIGRRPATVHKLVLTVILTGGVLMLFVGASGIIHAMGKNTDLTGRTAIWATVIPMVPNSVVGAGFESFWLGPRLQKMWRIFPVFRPNEAHNGYLEVYLNLGYVGVGLIGLILINGYWRAVAVYRRDPTIGGLMLAYVVAAATYSVTEAGFRLLDPIWVFLLLAVVSPSRVGYPVGGGALRPLSVPCKRNSTLATRDTPTLSGRNS